MIDILNHQWSLYEPNIGINMIPAWDIATGRGVVVAVLDTGYLFHEDYENNLVGPGYDFITDPEIALDGDGRDANALDQGDADINNDCGVGASASSWHGSHVAGTIAATADNGLGIAGIAFNARILPVRILGKCGGFSSDIADAVTWASGGDVAGVPRNATPAQVINLSLGGQADCSNSLQNAINGAISRGSTVVVAAGNDGVDASTFSPANCEGVITVAATTRSGDRASYSNFGDSVHLAAPGGDQRFSAEDGIISTVDRGRETQQQDIYAFYVGTSMAAPSVAGVAALFYELDPNIPPQRVKTLLMASTDEFFGSCEGCGTGNLDAFNAVRTLRDLTQLTIPTEDNNPDPVDDGVSNRTPGDSISDSDNTDLSDNPVNSNNSNDGGGGAFGIIGMISLLGLVFLASRKRRQAKSCFITLCNNPTSETIG